MLSRVTAKNVCRRCFLRHSVEIKLIGQNFNDEVAIATLYDDLTTSERDYDVFGSRWKEGSGQTRNDVNRQSRDVTETSWSRRITRTVFIYSASSTVYKTFSSFVVLHNASPSMIRAIVGQVFIHSACRQKCLRSFSVMYGLHRDLASCHESRHHLESTEPKFTDVVLRFILGYVIRSS